jgi:rfaE bifunctional protein nucleotidyltransferase chain/domain
VVLTWRGKICVALKGLIKDRLRALGYRCVDLGPFAAAPSVDYVDYARQLGTMMQNRDGDWGILVCGTGVGMSIVANKADGVRAALVHNMESARKSREHNDADVLCLGAWINDDDTNLAIVETWLGEKFGEHRHVKRVEKIAPHRATDIVLANGVFDILHLGHIELLAFAKSLGGRLVVAINSDRAVRELRGPARPVNSENDRKAVLQAVKHVDEVVIFDDVSPASLINELQPDIVVKGGEWTADEVRRRDRIPDHIAVKVFPLVSGYSSSNTILTIRQA